MIELILKMLDDGPKTAEEICERTGQPLAFVRQELSTLIFEQNEDKTPKYGVTCRSERREGKRVTVFMMGDAAKIRAAS